MDCFQGFRYLIPYSLLRCCCCNSSSSKDQYVVIVAVVRIVANDMPFSNTTITLLSKIYNTSSKQESKYFILIAMTTSK